MANTIARGRQARDGAYRRAWRLFARAGSGCEAWINAGAESLLQALSSFHEERHYGVLATTDAHGHAVARPVAYTVLGTSFWFATVAGARLRNLKPTPWASVVIEDGERAEHRAVAADGSVRITEQPAAQLLDVWQGRHNSGRSSTAASGRSSAFRPRWRSRCSPPRCLRAGARGAAAGLQDFVEIRTGHAAQSFTRIDTDVDFLFLDGNNDLYMPVLQQLEPRLSEQTIVVADMSPGDPHRARYREQVTARYVATELPLGAGLMSVRSSSLA